jgi:DNA-directed RNA polymerase subunit delta
MKRVIIDHKKLSPALLDLLIEKFPDGHDDKDIISFKNAQGEWVECLEVRTEDTLILVKINKHFIVEVKDQDLDEEENDEMEIEDFEEP